MLMCAITFKYVYATYNIPNNLSNSTETELYTNITDNI